MREFSRGLNESLIIGDGLSVTVLDIHADYVRIEIINPHEEPARRIATLWLNDDDDGVQIETTPCMVSENEFDVLADSPWALERDDVCCR